VTSSHFEYPFLKHKGVGIRAEIGLKNRQIINDTCGYTEN
jgi:hypothetical protein